MDVGWAVFIFDTDEGGELLADFISDGVLGRICRSMCPTYQLSIYSVVAYR